MKALVTGASGFIGANVVRALLQRDYQVRALIRTNSPFRNLDGLKVEVAYGDLCDRESLESALVGCEVLFHVAAAYTFWTSHPLDIYTCNVQGTENLLGAAAARGIKKVVYTSSESTIGIERKGCLGTEAKSSRLNGLPGYYKKSKLLAEQIALKVCGQDLPVVVVNPTVPVGAYDIKPTPTGRMVLGYLERRFPAYVDTGLNLVDVEDVAQGHVLALEKGLPGQRYILGNQNLTLKEIFGILERITGIKAPRRRIPIWLALGAAYGSELKGKLLRKEPGLPVAEVKTLRNYRYFDCSKAINELGLPQTRVETALEKAVKWFRQNGYVR